jgi:DGQHR domain-containing protein
MIRIQDSFSDSLTILKKEKKHRSENSFYVDELFENQVWNFLFDIGFSKMNVGRECEVSYGKDINNIIKKKIDILAESNEARLYIECTTQQDSTLKIKQWISDVEEIRKYENSSDETRDKNVVFILVSTQDFNNTDLLKLKEKGIIYLNRTILDYFNELIKLYRNLAYYQFLSFLLNGKSIKSIEKCALEIPAIQCKYSSKEYCYLFGIQPAKLIPISSVLHRKLTLDNDIPTNYQRLVKATKIKEIKKFITEERGVFPTNIIISFESKSDFFKPKGAKINDIQFGVLSLPNQFQSITVIDGQHRLFAYDGLEQAEKDLIYVVAFHKLTPEKQVQTFININEKQTKVSSSLMWDLYPNIIESNSKDYIKARISLLVKKLNTEKTSALQGTIHYDSAEYSNKGSKITLESICTAIKSEGIVQIIDGKLDSYLVKNNKEKLVYQVLEDYFNTIKKLNPEHWERKEKTRNLLRSNQGIGALIKLLKEIVRYIDKKGVFYEGMKTINSNSILVELLTPVNKLVLNLKTTEDIKKFKRIGEGGKQQIFIDFVKEINQTVTDFGNDVIERLENEELEAIRADLISNSEHQTLEAKESFFSDTKRLKATGVLERNSDEAIKGIVKTVVAFSNYLGGNIVIGLNDPQFEYIGIDNTDLKLYDNDWDKFKQSLSQKIESETINLTRRPEIKRIIHNNKNFAIIRVKGLDKKRFEDQDLVVLKYDKCCYKRENGDSMQSKFA